MVGLYPALEEVDSNRRQENEQGSCNEVKNQLFLDVCKGLSEPSDCLRVSQELENAEYPKETENPDRSQVNPR